MDARLLIEDELFENLRASFLHSGWGRPRMLPKDVCITNKLLIQLAYLREEGNQPENIIDKWLANLVPDVTTMAGASSRFSHLATTTMQFLSKKSGSEQRKIFKIARRKAPLMRQESKAAEEAVKQSIREKFVDNQRKKIEKEIEVINNRSKIRDNVSKHGGPCRRSQDVDELEERLTSEGLSMKQITEIFKNEIRFQKIICGSKLKFGSLAFMMDSLRTCLASRSPPPPINGLRYNFSQ